MKRRWLIFLFTLFTAFAAFADLKPLNQQAVIRVYISNAPGMGHQSASVVVMRRLRQLGFRGEFEVIYSDATAEKLKTLLPGFVARVSGWQEMSDLKIKAIAESDFKKIESLPEVEIAISGADDNRKNMTPAKLFAENYILMEPLGWGDSFHFTKNQVRKIPGIGGLGFKYDIDDSKEALAREFSVMETLPEQAEKVAGLKAILSIPSEMGAIYGVGLIPQLAEKIRIWVEGLQMAGRAQKFNKPLILPIISPLNDYEMQMLKYHLSLLEMSQSEKTAKKIHLLDIKDPGVPGTVKSLKAGDVLLVQTGRLPQPVFEALFKRSRLPVLVAGKNAMNLAQNLGKAYINTVKDYGFKREGSDSESEKIIKDAFEAFYFTKDFDKYIRQLSKFIQASLNPESSLSRYFYKLGPQGRDKVSEALSFVGVPDLSNGGPNLCASVFL